MSKLTRALILGATLAAMNLAGMTAVAQAQATNEAQGRPAATHRTPSRRDLAPPASSRITGADRRGRRPPAAAGPRAPLHPQRDTRPGARPSARRTERDSPAGSSLPSVSWPLPLRSPAGWPCWPPSEPAAELGSGTRPDRVTVTPLDGAAAPTRQPHRLAGDGLLAYLAGGHGIASVRWSGRGCKNASLRP